MSATNEKPPVRVIFVRHGETQHNVDAVISSGVPGMRLTVRGKRQAEEASAVLAAAKPTRIVSSPLVRAWETASILGSSLGLLVAEDPDLRECGVGSLEGKGDQASFAAFDGALEAWHLRGESEVALGGDGETGNDVAKRFAAAVERAVGRADPGATVVLVCHQTILLYAVAVLCENLVPSQTYRKFIPNLGTIEIDATGGGYHCVTWGGAPVDADFEGQA